jgi:hypothetical protein
MGVKISNLPNDSAPTNTDYIVVYDAETGATKKVLLSNLFSQALIGTSGIADDAITSAKLDGIDKSLLSVDSNPYKFSAYNGSSQTTVATTWTKLQFNTERYDTNNNYNTSTYGYTIPVNGYYLFIVMVQLLSQAASPFLVSFSKDGTTEYKRGSEIPNTTGNITLNGIMVDSCTAGQIVYPMYYSGQSGKTINNSIVTSTFEGFLVSRT